MELQVIYIFILSVLTVVLTAVGIYLILVLKEFRGSIQKANKILDDVENLTDVVAHPLNIVSGIIKGYQSVKNLYEKDKEE